MEPSSTHSKVIVTATGSYVATAINFVAAYISLSALGPDLIGLFQTYLLVKTYALYLNLGEVQSIRKQGAVLWMQGEHREFQRYQDQTLTVALLTVFVVVSMISVVGMVMLRPTGLKALTFTAVLILFGIEYLQYFFGNCLAARNEFELWTRGAVILAASSLILLVLILPFGYLGFLLSKVVAGIVFLLYLVRVLKYRVRLTRHTTEFRTMVKVGLPMSVIGFLSNYFVTADRLVVVHRLGTFQMGIYSVVPMIGLPLALFVQAASAVLFTRSSHLLGARSTPKEIVEDVAEFTRSTDRFVPHLVGILVFFLPLVISFLLPRYQAGIAAAQIALLGYCFYGIVSPFANLFIVLDHPRQFIGILMACGSVILMLGTAGVALGWGLAGVAIGSAVGSLTYSLATLYLPLRWVGYGTLDALAFLARQIRNSLVLMGVASAALCTISIFGRERVLLSTIVGVIFTVASAQTLARLVRGAARYTSQGRVATGAVGGGP